MRTDAARRLAGALDDPELRGQFEELKRLLGLAAERRRAGDLDGHEQAARAAVVAANELSGAIRAPTGLALQDDVLGKLLINLAYQDMLGALFLGRYEVPAFDVRLPVGRPRGRRSGGRRQLLDAVAANPELGNSEITHLGQALDPKAWPADGLDDYDSRRRRIARVRRDAVK